MHALALILGVTVLTWHIGLSRCGSAHFTPSTWSVSIIRVRLYQKEKAKERINKKQSLGCIGLADAAVVMARASAWCTGEGRQMCSAAVAPATHIAGRLGAFLNGAGPRNCAL